MERILPRRYLIVKIVFHVILPKSWYFSCSINGCQHKDITSSFSFLLYLMIDMSYVCLNRSHFEAFWLVFTAPCGKSALYLFSRKIGRNGIIGMVVMSKTRLIAVMVHVILLVHKWRVWTYFCLLWVNRFIGVYASFKKLNAFGHSLQLQVLC